MAKFKGKDLYLADNDQIYFGDNQEAAMWYEGTELQLNHTISGVRAIAPYHLVRYDQLTEASGTLQSQIDNLDNIYATDAELTSVSGILQSQITQNTSDISNNYITLDNKIDTTSGTLQSQIDSLDDIYATDVELASVSGSLQSQITLYSDHGNLSGLADDDHPQYLTRTDFTTYSGTMVADWTAADAIIDAKIDTTSGTLQSQITTYSDHGNLSGLTDDDHPQYLLRTDFTTYSGAIVDQIPTDYYTTGEVDTISGALSAEIDSDIATHTAIADAHHSRYTDAEAVSATESARTTLSGILVAGYTAADATLSGILSAEIDADIAAHESTYDHTADLTEYVQDVIGTSLSGINIAVSYDDGTGITTLSGADNSYSQEIKFAPADFQLPTAGKPSYGINEPLGVLLFGDTEKCYSSFKIPDNYKSGTDITLYVDYFNAEAQTGTNSCDWYLDYRIYSDGDVNGSKTTTTVSVSDTLPNNATIETFQLATITLANDDSNNPLTAGNSVGFMFYRGGADTLTGEAALLNATFKITCEA